MHRTDAEHYDDACQQARQASHNIGERKFVVMLEILLDKAIADGYQTHRQAAAMMVRVVWYSRILSRNLVIVTPADNLGGTAFRCKNCQGVRIQPGFHFCPDCRSPLSWEKENNKRCLSQ